MPRFLPSIKSYVLYSLWVYDPISPFHTIQIISIVYLADLAPLSFAKLRTPQNYFIGFALFRVV